MPSKATEAFNFTRDMLLRIDARLDSLSTLVSTANAALAVHRVELDRLGKDVGLAHERIDAHKTECAAAKRGLGLKEWVALVTALGAGVTGALAAWASRGRP